MELEYLSAVIGSGLEKQEIVVQLSTEVKDFLASLSGQGAEARNWPLTST